MLLSSDTRKVGEVGARVKYFYSDADKPCMSRTTRTLASLMDARTIQLETGLPRRTVETLMRRCELVRPPGVRRVFVYRADIEALLSPGG